MKIKMTDCENISMLVDGDLKDYIHSLANTCRKMNIVFTYRFCTHPNREIELMFRTKSHAFTYYLYTSAFGRSDTLNYLLEVNSNITVNIATMMMNTVEEYYKNNPYINMRNEDVVKVCS